VPQIMETQTVEWTPDLADVGLAFVTGAHNGGTL